jgi:hypothetical protein
MRKAAQSVFVVMAVALSSVFVGRADVVGQWLFDEGAGDVAKDTSGNKNDGKVNNAKWVTGKFGKALEFSGSNSNVEIQWAPVLSVEKFTLMAWVNVPGFTGTWQTIVTQNTDGPIRNYGTFINNAGGVIHYSFTFGKAWQSFDAKTGVVDGKWHHICATYDKESFILYVDGIEDARQARNVTPDTAKTVITIGSWVGGGWMKGAIDEVALFNNALKPADIKNVISNGVGSKPVDPQGKVAATWAALKAR